MKKILTFTGILIFLLFLFNITVSAEEVYEFKLNDADKTAEGIFEEFLNSIPEDIKKELPESDYDTIFEEYDQEYFFEKISDSIQAAVGPTVKTVALLLGIVILSAVFNVFANNISDDKLKGIFSFCSSLCVALSIFSSMKTVFDTVKTLLDSLSKTMLALIPAMEAVYIQGGNLTGAAVTSTGVNIMIGFTESLFSKIIEPCIYVAFILAVVGAVTKNPGIAFMVKSLRGLLTGGIIIIMTVMSFVLALQNSAAGAADTFTVKTLKFAIGNYIPLVGGTVAESFSLLSGSMGVIKQSCGTIGIAVMIVAFLPPFAIILMNRFAIGISGALAEVLGCEREGALIGECKSICTLLVAVSAGAVVMYIIALGIFCKTPLAVS